MKSFSINFSRDDNMFSSVDEKIKDVLEKWEKDGLIKPEYSLVPLINLAKDHLDYGIKLTDASYEEYEMECNCEGGWYWNSTDKVYFDE